jgi:hypothetical protein
MFTFFSSPAEVAVAAQQALDSVSMLAGPVITGAGAVFKEAGYLTSLCS